jgi:hypothetical protein
LMGQNRFGKRKMAHGRFRLQKILFSNLLKIANSFESNSSLNAEQLLNTKYNITSHINTKENMQWNECNKQFYKP